MATKKENIEKKERKKNWRETFATVDEIKAFLMDHILLRHNMITGRVEYRAPETDVFREYEGDVFRGYESTEVRGYEDRPSDSTTDLVPPHPRTSEPPNLFWVPITDRVVNSLWAEISKQKPVRAQDIYRVIESDFVPAYHPMRYYLEHLPHWDGQNWIMEMSVSVSVKGDVHMQMRFAEYLTKWLVGMVAAWVDSTVVNNVILVLIGEQGSYKTTWFNYVLPPELRQYFYTKTNANRMGRDDLLTLAQYALVCCEELDSMRPAELNQLKAAVTMTTIDERAAYAHFHEHRPHIASFCGTGNNVQFLSDPTGNRRWLPFEIESIDSPRDHPFNYEGIYAQAYALYQQGFRYWFTQDEIAVLNQHNRHFETPRLEAELVDVFFSLPTAGNPGTFMPVSRALQIIGGHITHELSPLKLGRAFADQGFRQVRRPNCRGYIVVQRTEEEIRTRMNLLANEDDEPF